MTSLRDVENVGYCVCGAMIIDYDMETVKEADVASMPRNDVVFNTGHYAVLKDFEWTYTHRDSQPNPIEGERLIDVYFHYEVVHLTSGNLIKRTARLDLAKEICTACESGWQAGSALRERCPSNSTG